jgi:endonuclease/exonuclease/phosphatase family metal-dependent hydrolase
MNAIAPDTGSVRAILIPVALSLLIVSGCQEAPPSETWRAVPFRVMSYNIRYNNPGDAEHAWPHRVDRVASTILFNQAELVGVQEALKGQLDDLAERLPEYAWLGVGRDDGKESGEYSAIFYRTDRFAPVDSGTFWLSKNPSIPGSKDWDAAITRVATWAHFRDLAADTSLFYFNTHFDHRGVIAREKSAELLENRIARMAGSYPTVLTGDLNFTEEAPGYAALTSSLRDVFYESGQPHHGPVSTIYGGFQVTHETGRRIDYIFVKNNLKPLQHATLSDNWEGHFASDHLAVLATLLVD